MIFSFKSKLIKSICLLNLMQAPNTNLYQIYNTDNEKSYSLTSNISKVGEHNVPPSQFPFQMVYEIIASFSWFYSK